MSQTLFSKPGLNMSQDFSQQKIPTNGSKILEILSCINHSHIEKESIIEHFKPYKQPIENWLDTNNNNVYFCDDLVKKASNKIINIKKQHHKEPFQREVSKEYILSQLKAQQRIKQYQQEKQNVNNSTHNFQKPIFSHRDKSSDKIEIFNDGNVKNIPPHLLLDQFGIIGLVMMMKINQSNKNLSLIMGQGEESNAITESINIESEYDSIFFFKKTNHVNHLEQVDSKNNLYDLSEIRKKLPDANSILKNVQDDLLFFFFYKCSLDFYQLLATKMLNLRANFLKLEMKLKEKYDIIIENLSNKSLSCDELITHLTENRYRNNSKFRLSLNDLTDDLNSKTDILIDNSINSSFVSYFLTLIHEEANRYLPLKNFQNNHSIKNQNSVFTNFTTPPNSKVISLNKLSDTENIFDSSMSNVNTPNSNFKNRKIILKPLPSNGSRNSSANSPVEQNSPHFRSNNFKRHNTFAGSSVSSPNTGILSPRNGNNITPTYLSSKLNNKATLFDFIITPNTSPSNQKPSHSQTLINDFKNRFVQHQNKLKSNQTNVKNQKTPQSPLIIQSNTDSQILNNDQLSEAHCKSITIDPSPTNEKKNNIDYSKLGETVKNSLKSNELLKISTLSDFYCQLIINNFALTLNTELFFLFQLLTLNSIEDKRNYNPKENSSFRIFETIETCIFFAIKSINNLECILKHLKNSTLMELNENIYIKSFSELSSRLSPIFGNELSKEEIKQKSKLVFLDLKVVPFNADFSTRFNFSDKNFLVTCKNQRDLFYDILWNWEKNHCLENWNFSEYYGEKIRHLVSCKDNLSSFFEFVKLFLDQLVLMCKDDKMLINNQIEERNETIKGLNDPIKLKKLNARMSTPDPYYGPNPEPKFIGYQEFFKEFIDISNSPKFHQILKDCIANEIEIIHREIPDFECKNENSFQKEFFEEILLKLRILGKFFGYLVFYSYQYPVPNCFLKDFASIRNNQSIPIKLEAYLEKALIKKHLILTVPFVVEFLSMMDENAYLVESIQQTFNFLIMIYNSKFLLIKSGEFTIDKLLLLMKIAWLLQLKKISMNQIKVKENYPEENNKVGVDNMSFVTPLLLHFCCPYLDELQKLLARFSTGVKRAAQKIKDSSHLFSVEIVRDQPNKIIESKDIQMKLIAQFLNTNPSHKKIIEFISESAFVSFVKLFRQNDLKEIIEELNNQLIIIHKEKKNDHIEYENILQNLSKSFSKKISTKCIESGKKFFESKIECLVSKHLENTSAEQVITICYQIAMFKSVDKLTQWIKTNLTDIILFEEIKLKKIKTIQSCEKVASNIEFPLIEKNNLNFCVESSMPSEIFSLTKNVQKQILIKENEFFKIRIEILTLLEKIRQFNIKNTNDNKLIKSVKLYLAQVSFEMILLFIINYTDDVIDENIVECYIKIQNSLDKSDHSLVLEWVENPRNLFMFKKNCSENTKNNLKFFIQKISENLSLDKTQLNLLMDIVYD